MNNKATQSKQNKNLNNVVNDPDWHNLSEISQGKFAIKREKSSRNIDSITNQLKNVAQTDDALLDTMVADDADNHEAITSIKNNFKIKQLRKATKDSKDKLDSETLVDVALEDSKELHNNKEVFTQHNFNAMQVGEEAQDINITHNEDAVTDVSSVIPQTSNVTLSSPKYENAMQGLLKFAALGFAHLYVKKTTKVLKPLGFVAENIEKVSIGFLHLIVPLLMTWLITTKVEFFASQLQQMGTIPVVLCNIAFYVASIFVWISTQVIVAGLINVCKKTLRDVAKVGEENR